MALAATRRSRKQDSPPKASGRTIVVVGVRKQNMERVFQQVAPHKPSHVEFLRSPQALLSHIGGSDSDPWLYVFDTTGRAASVRNVSPTRYGPWLEVLQVVQAAKPTTPVLVVASEEENYAWDALLEAGADELITPASLKSPAVVKRRIESAFAHARSEGEASALDIEAEAPLSEAQIAAALGRVRAAVNTRSREGARRSSFVDLLAVAAPELRAASGRLDAQRIAERLGVSLNAFAAAMPVSRETLRINPDSKKIQQALHVLARVLDALDVLIPGEGGRQWLNAPHPRFGMTPLDAMLAGRAEDVARLLELAREGDID